MPFGGGPHHFAGPRDEGLPRVSPDSALTHSAYWACVSTIADDLAAIPWGTFQKLPGGGRRSADDHVVDWLLSTQPNGEQTAFVLRQAWIKYALVWGNSILEIERDGAGRPLALWLIEPWRVRPCRDAGGLYYRVTNPGREDDLLLPSDVLHLMGMGDGCWGYSVLEYAARTVGIALATDRHAGRLFANDGRPGVVIEFKGKLGDKQAKDRFRDGWERRHRGNANAPAVLENGATAKVLDQVSPQDAQLLASRQFSASDIARFFKVPPHKIGDLSRSTNNNIEQQALEYIQGTLQPWAVRMEQEANLKLFGLKQRGTYYTKLNFGSLMRGDSAARSQYLNRMVTSGLMCLDDGREVEDLPPIPGGLGKKFFVPVNLQTLERAVNPPAPATPTTPAPVPTPAADNPPPSGEKEAPAEPDPSAVLRPVFRDAAGRVLRREAHRAADALKRLGGDAAGLAAWRDAFLAEHRSYFAKAFGPAAAALAGDAAAVGVVLGEEAAAECEAFALRFAALPGPDGIDLAGEWDRTGGDALADRVMARVAAAKHHSRN